MTLRIGKSKGFAPIARSDARVLILGTLPGTVALAQGQYYAQPRNAFWRIMGEVVGASVDVPYSERTRWLVEKGIALWDVCAAAQRLGASDSAIDSSMVEANDFDAFLTRHSAIRVICFNGAKAAKLYSRKILPTLSTSLQSIRRETLPSTSPAYAAMPFAEKLARWRTALGSS